MERARFAGIGTGYLVAQALLLAALALAAGGVSYAVFRTMSDDFSLASDFAVARGTMQRAVKLAALGRDWSEQVRLVDGIIARQRVELAGNEFMSGTRETLRDLERV